jgi:hypothetical protein
MIELDFCGFKYNKLVNIKQENDLADPTKIRKAISKNLLIPEEYKKIFFSDMNTGFYFIVVLIVASFKKITKKPKVAVSRFDNPSYLDILKDLSERGFLDIQYLKTDINGDIDSKALQLDKDVCCLIVPYVNRLTGIYYDLKTIGEIAHGKHIPLISDFSRLFTFEKANQKNNFVDVLLVDMGVPNLSMISINPDLISGFNLNKKELEINEAKPIDFFAGEILYEILKIQNFSHKKFLIKKLKFVSYEDIVKNNSQEYTKPIIFGNVDNSPVVSILMPCKKKLKRYNFCDINKSLFSELGVLEGWHKNILVLGLGKASKKELVRLAKDIN